ncbi:hypothetical protein [Nocardioides limicola]|uniref:hypothetical protein n=1 Tax=Nocardioides limicola TaxID=2803368 RepID=UPI00193C18ED|nr:hypothetical protein [Nocardioides sp. DJM-14]
MSHIEFPSREVAAAIVAWDDQRHRLRGCRRRLEEADSTGFTESVVGAAARFLSAWQGHTGAMADRCGGTGVDLADQLNDFYAADEFSATLFEDAHGLMRGVS